MPDISEHVAALKGAMEDNEAFDKAVLRLRGDRSITKNHMQDVAHQVIGWRPGNANNREGHLDYIRRHQTGIAAAAARIRTLDKKGGGGGMGF